MLASFLQIIAVLANSSLTPTILELEADYSVILGDRLCSICQHGELRISGIRKRIDKAMDTV